MTIGLLELQVLRELAGEVAKREHGGEGSAFVRALEGLRGAGYIDKIGNVTPDGVAALRRNESEET